MRLKKDVAVTNFNVIIVDDEQGIIDSMSVFLKRSGYRFKGFTNPFEAIESIRDNKYDLLILDYIMDSIHGNEVVEKIRSFNSNLYILLLTGHKDMAPPVETLKSLDIQGYCEKSDRFDQLLLLIESARKSVDLMKKNIRYEEGLNKILQSVPKIYQLHPIGIILKDILREILPFVKSENAFILVDDLTQSIDEKCLNDESIYRGIGSYDVDVDEFLQMLDPYMLECIGTVRMDKVLLKIDGGVILPLLYEDKSVLGIIYIESVDFEEGLRLLEIYSVQATLSIKNAFLHSLVNIKNSELNKTYEELKTRYFDTIQALRLTVDARDVYTRGHSDRVAYYGAKVGKAMGLCDEDVELLKLGGIFHDIGKISTADDVLFKNQKLTKEEYDEIKKHPLRSAHILSAISMFQNVVPIVKSHHERIDGNGYPDGLKGDDIPLLARIICVVDAFDAMTSNRVYRTRLSISETKYQLISGKGMQFDEKVVDAFIKLLDDYESMQDDLKSTYELDANVAKGI